VGVALHYGPDVLLDVRDERVGLSSREAEVLAPVAKGRANREIARALLVSEVTVKTHLGHVFAKLGFNDRASAVATAYERGHLSG